jgi:hypothetical protein
MGLSEWEIAIIKMDRTDLLGIIKDYIACAKYMCNALKDRYEIKAETLQRARRINLVPDEGYLPDNIRFSFDRMDCHFEFETGTIDINISPDDRFDNFDFHRIVSFLKLSKLPKYKMINDFENLEIQFNKLLEDNIILCPQLHPRVDACYLNTAVS